jgi:hypothetical protein
VLCQFPVGKRPGGIVVPQKPLVFFYFGLREHIIVSRPKGVVPPWILPTKIVVCFQRFTAPISGQKRDTLPSIFVSVFGLAIIVCFDAIGVFRAGPVREKVAL